MNENAERAFEPIDEEACAFRAYLRAVKGSAPHVIDFADPGAHVAFWDALFEEMNAMDYEPLDEGVERIPFRRKAVEL